MSLDNKVTRTLSELSDKETVRISIDLVSAVKRNIEFLRTVNESSWLHEKPIIAEAIRRYEELWMPLICDISVGSTPPMVLPPLDIEWVWFCHTLNPVYALSDSVLQLKINEHIILDINNIHTYIPFDCNKNQNSTNWKVGYRKYCESRFSKLIGKPSIFNEENEEYALIRCREIWTKRYPSEPFEIENESNSDPPIPVVRSEDLWSEVMKQRFLYLKFPQPYMMEIMYLIAARQRYKGFLYILQRLQDGFSCLVPTSDILIMWLTHQSYPTVYAEDLKVVEDDMVKVAEDWDTLKEGEVEESKRIWERTFGQPYEKAGGGIATKREGVALMKPPVYWETFDTDVDTKYKSLAPRFLLEVCVFVKLNSKMKAMQEDRRRDFLRLRVIRCHKELKMDQPLAKISYDTWQKAWHLYCEFGTRGIIIEVHREGGHCFKGSVLKNTLTFLWNDLLRAPTLTLGREIEQQIGFVTSITPPVQAPYLLKCVPDRVTDDSGAMISDVILRMNQYRPQEGRWLSRTVLDHAGRECFVIRLRVGEGRWRRSGETPSNVKWEDRIIEIREGSWSYVAGSIGKAPVKVVGTATPKEPADQQSAAWCFSTGDELLLRWESSTPTRPIFSLSNPATPELSVKLLWGRRMQYQVRKHNSKRNDREDGTRLDEVTEEYDDEEEESFVTLIRFSDENPSGRATALINWKLLVVEFIPEEDAVLVLLLCIAILRSMSEMRKEDIGQLLIRRRVKEAKLGARDWGSVILNTPSPSASPYLQPWHWNAKTVMVSDGANDIMRQPVASDSAAEGGDKLYKKVIIS